MKAGRELDKLIAEKIFGWKRIAVPASWMASVKDECGSYEVYPPDSPEDRRLLHDCLNYSTSIADAWPVFCQFPSRYLWHSDGTWWCYLDSQRVWMDDCRYAAWSEDDTGAEAICLAALRAVGYKESA